MAGSAGYTGGGYPAYEKSRDREADGFRLVKDVMVREREGNGKKYMFLMNFS